MKFLASVRLALLTLVVLTVGFAHAQFISTGVQVTTSTTATLNYTTAAPAATIVQWGTATYLGNAQSGETVISFITNKHTTTIIGLTPNTKYQYRIIATDLFGETVVGSYRNFTTPAVGHTVALSWSEADTNVTFNVYRSQTPGQGYVKLSAVTNTVYVDPNVITGQTYYYVTTAVDPTGKESPFSNEVEVPIQ